VFNSAQRVIRDLVAKGVDDKYAKSAACRIPPTSQEHIHTSQIDLHVRRYLSYKYFASKNSGRWPTHVEAQYINSLSSPHRDSTGLSDYTMENINSFAKRCKEYSKQPKKTEQKKPANAIVSWVDQFITYNSNSPINQTIRENASRLERKLAKL
jgi:hypothetical protein